MTRLCGPSSHPREQQAASASVGRLRGGGNRASVASPSGVLFVCQHVHGRGHSRCELFVVVTTTSAGASTAPVTVTATVLEPFVGGSAGSEFLASHSDALITSGTCNPSGDTTYTFSVSGQATGPYAGTFTETGSVTIGAQTDEIPGSPGQFRGPITAFSSTFDIVSPSGSVHGTKTLANVVLPPDAGNAGGCITTPSAQAGQILAGNLVYTASITAPGGSVVTDTGTSAADFNAATTPGTSPSSNLFREFYFTSTLPVPPPQPPATGADLALTKEGPATANAGEELTYHDQGEEQRSRHRHQRARRRHVAEQPRARLHRSPRRRTAPATSPSSATSARFTSARSASPRSWRNAKQAGDLRVHNGTAREVGPG